MWAASLGCAGEMETVIVLGILILQWVELKCSLPCLICKAAAHVCERGRAGFNGWEGSWANSHPRVPHPMVSRATQFDQAQVMDAVI
jgi:hypothetical protein